MKPTSEAVTNRTLVICVGNTDDKLTQKEWYKFVARINNLVHSSSVQVHFFGGPPSHAQWQNAAWLFEIDSKNQTRILNQLSEQLKKLGEEYNQDSIFVMYGFGKFI